jgi:hypothetical protein
VLSSFYKKCSNPYFVPGSALGTDMRLKIRFLPWRRKKLHSKISSITFEVGFQPDLGVGNMSEKSQVKKIYLV